MTEADGRGDPVVINVGELSLTTPATALWRAGLTPHQGSTIEPTLSVEVWVSQPQSSE